MELSTAVRLTESGISESDRSQEWADLGAGSGLFTRALLQVLSPNSVVHAVDQDERALSGLRTYKPDQIKIHVLNFEAAVLPFSNLDGILLANALHFVKDQPAFLQHLKRFLSPHGRIILIEYDLAKPNPWVPYPIPFSNLDALMKASGFSKLQKLSEVPSRFNSSMIYSCLVQP